MTHRRFIVAAVIVAAVVVAAVIAAVVVMVRDFVEPPDDSGMTGSRYDGRRCLRVLYRFRGRRAAESVDFRQMRPASASGTIEAGFSGGL